MADAAVTRTSVDKVNAAIDELIEQADPMMAMVLGAIAPLLPEYLPTDPAELDDQLLTLAKMALTWRSDDAPQPETINQIFGIEPLPGVTS